jgi:hypothetical protein
MSATPAKDALDAHWAAYLAALERAVADLLEETADEDPEALDPMTVVYVAVGRTATLEAETLTRVYAWLKELVGQGTRQGEEGPGYEEILETYLEGGVRFVLERWPPDEEGRVHHLCCLGADGYDYDPFAVFTGTQVPSEEAVEATIGRHLAERHGGKEER